MARVGSIVHQVAKIIKAHNGIGISKREARNESGLIAENNHKVSNYFHSYKSLDNARRGLINLGKFAKEEFNIKDMSNIDKEVVKEWIKSKNISSYTASNYLSEISKVREHLNITQEEIKELRQEFHKSLEKTREVAKTTRAYKNLDKVKIADRSQISFELQKDYGLRAKEAIHINLTRQLKDNILTVQSKGGKQLEIKISDKLAQDIRAAANKNNIFNVNYKTYTRDLKEAIEKTGQKYNGTHGIRHTFAQKKLEEGYTKAQVSEMLGHVREEITDVYIR
jgi:integrase